MTEAQKYLATRYKELKDKLDAAMNYTPGNQDETDAWQTWIGAATNELEAMENEYDNQYSERPPPIPPPPPPWWH